MINYLTSTKSITGFLLAVILVLSTMVLWSNKPLVVSAKSTVIDKTYTDRLVVRISESSLKDIQNNKENYDAKRQGLTQETFFVSEGEVIVMGNRDKIEKVLSEDNSLQCVNLLVSDNAVEKFRVISNNEVDSDNFETLLVRSPFVNSGLPELIVRGHSTKQLMEKFHLAGLYVEPDLGYFQPEFELNQNIPQYDSNSVITDPLEPMQLNMRAVRANEETNRSMLTASKTYAMVVDGYIDRFNDPDLSNQFYINKAEENGRPGVDDDNDGVIDNVYTADFSQNPPTGNPTVKSDFHGPAVAGIILAERNGFGAVGLTEYNASGQVGLVPVNVLGSDRFIFTSYVIKALEYAFVLKQRGLNLSVVNMSIGGFANAFSLAVSIAKLNDLGVLVVCGAGNDKSLVDGLKTLADATKRLHNGITVGALDLNTMQKLEFSNFGNNLVYAPGNNTVTTTQGGILANFGNTSGASPHVSGIGCLLELAGVRSPYEKKQQIFKSSTPTVDGLNFVNAKAAVDNDYQITVPDKIFVKTVTKSGNVLKVKVSGSMSGAYLLTSELTEIRGKQKKSGVYTFSLSDSALNSNMFIFMTDNGGMSVINLN